MSVEWTSRMRDAWEAHDLAEFERLLDQNYVWRWGWVKIPISHEMPVTSEILDFLKKEAKDRAEWMGGTIEDLDVFTISTNFPTCMDTYEWKVRRD